MADARIINPLDIQTRTAVVKLLLIVLTNNISLLLINTSNVISFELFIQIEHLTSCSAVLLRVTKERRVTSAAATRWAIKLNHKFVKLLTDFASIIKCLDIASMKQEEDQTVSSKKPHRSNLSR